MTTLLRPSKKGHAAAPILFSSTYRWFCLVFFLVVFGSAGIGENNSLNQTGNFLRRLRQSFMTKNFENMQKHRCLLSYLSIGKLQAIVIYFPFLSRKLSAHHFNQYTLTFFIRQSPLNFYFLTKP